MTLGSHQTTIGKSQVHITPKWISGDTVKPRPEWINDPNNVPTGRIISIAPCGSVYVEGERRAFAGYVFERVREETVSGIQRRLTPSGA